jgi:hypothetical protein
MTSFHFQAPRKGPAEPFVFDEVSFLCNIFWTRFGEILANKTMMDALLGFNEVIRALLRLCRCEKMGFK